LNRILALKTQFPRGADKMKKTLLDEFRAAVFIGMSPQLLRYLTGHHVKWKAARILSVAEKVHDILYFEENELKEYDDWLRSPWPCSKGKRPPLPDAIREEIRQEANAECAICKSSGQAGEAAHIIPVATSKNNHPHNLIWLCANHHTKLDNGSFGPKGAENEIILSLKRALHHFQRVSWLGQAEVSRQIAATLSLCGTMQKQLGSAKSKVEVQAVEMVAKQALALLPDLASQSKSTTVQPILDRLVTQLAQREGTTSERLKTAASFEQEFLLESGLARCPLCKGAKNYNGYDCPVCQGDGAVSEDVNIDLTEFEIVDCQICGGKGFHDGVDCPVCHGEQRIERRLAERIDIGQYAKVSCPLCDGNGRWRGADCPACSGNCEMPRHLAKQIDLDRFCDVNCPLCDGVGHYQGEDCPGCGGGGQLLAGDADRLDISQYALVDCPRCNGKGIVNGDDCRACGGNGKMQQRLADRLD
jgi:DnaJ-class molecular chaperone